MTRFRQRRRRGQSGAVLVEFALVLPVLVCILLGAITAGFALSTKNSVANAVREGTRLGATLPKGAGVPAAPNAWDPWAATVRDRVVGLSGGALTSAQVCVELHHKSSVGVTTEIGDWPNGACPFPGAPSVPASAPNASCVVLVWAHRTAALDAFFFRRELSLDAPAIARYERVAECP